jgi:hypothetical protein
MSNPAINKRYEESLFTAMHDIIRETFPNLLRIFGRWVSEPVIWQGLESNQKLTGSLCIIPRLSDSNSILACLTGRPGKNV